MIISKALEQLMKFTAKVAAEESNTYLKSVDLEELYTVINNIKVYTTNGLFTIMLADIKPSTVKTLIEMEYNVEASTCFKDLFSVSWEHKK